MDYNGNSHGTAVAGIIGAYRNNSFGVAGVAGGDASTGNSGVTLFALKAGNDEGLSPSAVAAAIIDAATPESEGGYGCDIINFSGGSESLSEAIRDAVKYAAARNVLVVAAKGNDDSNTARFPADLDNNWVLSVGASNSADFRLSGPGGSNYGYNLDVVAPGQENQVFTTKRVDVGGAGTFGGTSASAAVVSGIASLMKSINSDLHRDDIEEIIKISAEKKGVPTYEYTNGYNENMGFGRVNAVRALTYLQDPYTLIHRSQAGNIAEIENSQALILSSTAESGGTLPDGWYYGKRIRVTTTISKSFCGGENYFWLRMAGLTAGWSGANPNLQQDYIIVNETSTTYQLTTWVYYIQYNAFGQTINSYYPRSPYGYEFHYSTLGLKEFEIPNVIISGTSHFCTSDTYEVSNLPSGSTITWSATYPLAISGSASSNVVSLNALSISGTGILTATITNACGNFIIAKSIDVGLPPAPQISGNSSICASSLDNFYSIDPVLNATSYNWYMSPGPSDLQIFGNGGTNIYILSEVPGSYYLMVEAMTPCGPVYGEMPVEVISCFARSFVVYPNPADQEMTVNYEEVDKNSNKSKKVEKEIFFELRLLDQKGIVLRSAKSQGKNSVTFSTNDIPSGTYIVHIVSGKEFIKKQVIIKH